MMNQVREHAGARPDGNLAVRVVSTAADIPADVWSRLAPEDDPLWNQALFTAMERGNLGPDTYRYLLVERDDQIQAVLPTCSFHALDLADPIGADGRRVLAALKRLTRRSLTINIMFCGHLLGGGRVLRDARTDPRSPDALLRAVTALGRQLGTRWWVFKDFDADDLAWLQPSLSRAGFFAAPGMPDAVLSVTRQESFDDYVATLSRDTRKDVRTTLRRIEQQEDLRFEVRADFDDVVDKMMPLYSSVLESAESRLDRWTPEFFASLSSDANIPTKVVLCWRRDELLGFLLSFTLGSGATSCRIGLDYSEARPLRLYFGLKYRNVRALMEAGCTTINMTQTAYESKRRLGCYLVPLDHAVSHSNWLVRCVLRVFLQFAVNQSGVDSDDGQRKWASAPLAPNGSNAS